MGPVNDAPPAPLQGPAAQFTQRVAGKYAPAQNSGPRVRMSNGVPFNPGWGSAALVLRRWGRRSGWDFGLSNRLVALYLSKVDGV